MEFNKTILNFKEIDNLIDTISNKIEDNNSNICIGLIGDLGTGKTYFSKRLLKNLGIKEAVKSPTFTYMIEYSISYMDIYHFDVYRISNEDDLYNIGFFDFIDEDNSLVLVEWANLILDSMPNNTLYFEIEHNDFESRKISIYTLKGGKKYYVDINNYNFN